MPPDKIAFSHDNLTKFVERSLTNLGADAIDLLQLHCPPNEVYYMPETFGVLDDLVRGRQDSLLRSQRRNGRTSPEGHRISFIAIDPDHLQHFPPAPGRAPPSRNQTAKRGRFDEASFVVGHAGRKIDRTTKFETDDHRLFNRHGEAFDMGETFSGVDFETGLVAVDALRPLVPAGSTMAQFALRFILMHDAVTCVIPGAKREAQVQENVAASGQAPLPEATMATARQIYLERIAPLVHQRW